MDSCPTKLQVTRSKAPITAALDLQDMLIKPVQRYVKCQVERELFLPIITQSGIDPNKVRLNYGTPKARTEFC
ncbi:MAG: hypothetical protein M1540_08900 [Candidatus Bathyarchaeota archaeon]|nr:hypothetical protein [Candidatus Bathyarchaeota archaeon]